MRGCEVTALAIAVRSTLRVRDDFESTAVRRRQSPLVVVRQPLRRHDDDRHAGGRRIVPEPLEDVEAGHVGQPQIEQDDVGRCCVRLRKAIDAGRGLDQLVLAIVRAARG